MKSKRRLRTEGEAGGHILDDVRFKARARPCGQRLPTACADKLMKLRGDEWAGCELRFAWCRRSSCSYTRTCVTHLCTRTHQLTRITPTYAHVHDKLRHARRTPNTYKPCPHRRTHTPPHSCTHIMLRHARTSAYMHRACTRVCGSDSHKYLHARELR